ncbi:MAG: NADH-quinone oxidoreductase subunit NuoE, partial [Anaerolineae bacterium]
MLSEKGDQLEAILARYPDRQSAVLPVLYLAQQEYGYLTSEAVQEVANILGMSVTDVEAVVTFYSLFYDKPVGRYVIQVCDDLPCALVGADRLVDYLCQKLGIEVGGTTADGLFTLQTVKCVASCDKGPVMQVNLEYYEQLTEERVDEILDELRQRAEG